MLADVGTVYVELAPDKFFPNGRHSVPSGYGWSAWWAKRDGVVLWSDVNEAFIRPADGVHGLEVIR